MKVMRWLGQFNRIRNEKQVTKSAKFADVYEMRADKGHARIMFFYDPEAGTAICTNAYWKGKGSQDHAFQACDGFRKVYFRCKS